jgi:2-methylcitrate dehydratase
VDHASANADDCSLEAAHLCLLDALACALQALQQPACAKVLGPVVPGATMSFGARVPGTSLQLDPVQAAFNLGAMIGWCNQQDAALATPRGHLADTVPALLCMADFQARKALAEGRVPASGRDVLTVLADSGVRASTAAIDDALVGIPAAGIDRLDAARIDVAAAIASMLGATAAQRTRAIELAAGEKNSSTTTRAPWWLGDANARGVRLALIAMAEETSVGTVPPVAAPRSTMPLSFDEADADRIRDRFVASVTAHFPATQARKLKAVLLDQSRLEALPINEWVSLTVHN